MTGTIFRRSMTGTVFRWYNGAPISWRSKQQKTISLSTAEAVYYSASEGAVQALDIRGLVISMGFDSEGWTPIHEDNNACIEWGNNVIGGRERAKHIDIRKHFAHEVIQNGHIRLVRVDTADQLADVFAKSLQPAQFAACMSDILRRKWGS
jgi:hypothetical protein